MDGTVEAVSASRTHTLVKDNQLAIRLLAGLGVEGDAHMGTTVKHRSRVRRDPTRPNLRQVHLIDAELHDELRASGFEVSSGQMGENVTTRGIHLRALHLGTRLHLGEDAVIELTGLRTPCHQLNRIRPGLLDQVLHRRPDGALVRRAGVMAVVVDSGWVREGDDVRVELPPPPHRRLEPV